MRRPLFGNGIPQALDPSAALEVFDTTAADPPNEQHIFALSLYFWGDDVADGLSVSITTGGGTPVAYNNLTTAALAERRLSPNGAYLLADRLMLRGDQQVNVVSLGVESHGFVYGFFEMDGFTPDSPNLRPLQPSNTLVSPYNATPATLVRAAAAPATEVVAHLLDEDYIDIVWMNISAAVAGGALTGSPLAAILLPGGIIMPYTPQINSLLQNDIVFPGIPMRAPSDDDAEISLGLTSDDALTSAASLLGYFSRG